jgi:glycosyltransferase involved in cell wall biosynthesis
MVSVVMPVLNSAATLERQLSALAAQVCDAPWEVVVADNGSTDGSSRLARAFAADHPGFRVVDASAQRGPGAARNAGAMCAKGTLLAFCDADDVVLPGWLSAMARALQDSPMVAGACDIRTDVAREVAPDFAAPSEPPVHLGFLPFAFTCNMGITRALFDELGGFDESFRHAEDIDLSWRAQLAGQALAFEPDARVRKQGRSGLLSVWRQHFDFGRADLQLVRRYHYDGCRPIPVTRDVAIALWLMATSWRLLTTRQRRAWVVASARLAGRTVERIRPRGSVQKLTTSRLDTLPVDG